MEKAVLVDENRLILPESVLALHQWSKGMEFLLWDTGQELILKPMKKFAPSQLESPDTPSVYYGKPLSLEDMERAINMEAGKHA
jgi:hypothetical protein